MYKRLTTIIFLSGALVCGTSNATDQDQIDDSAPQTVLSQKETIEAGTQTRK